MPNGKHWWNRQKLKRIMLLYPLQYPETNYFASTDWVVIPPFVSQMSLKNRKDVNHKMISYSSEKKNTKKRLLQKNTKKAVRQARGGAKGGLASQKWCAEPSSFIKALSRRRVLGTPCITKFRWLHSKTNFWSWCSFPPVVSESGPLRSNRSAG